MKILLSNDWKSIYIPRAYTKWKIKKILVHRNKFDLQFIKLVNFLLRRRSSASVRRLPINRIHSKFISQQRKTLENYSRLILRLIILQKSLANCQPESMALKFFGLLIYGDRCNRTLTENFRAEWIIVVGLRDEEWGNLLIRSLLFVWVINKGKFDSVPIRTVWIWVEREDALACNTRLVYIHVGT